MNILDNPAWFNGTYCKVKDVNFSVLDLGVIHCDASYDVANSVDRSIFLLDMHIDRFINSCKGLRLPLSLDRAQIENIIISLCKQSNLDSLLIWMGVTRGVPNSGNPRDLNATTANLFFYVKPYYDFGLSNDPITMCLAKTLRTPDVSVNQNLKNWAWLDLTAAQWEAMDRGFDSAILLSTDGFISEGPGFGVWGIKDRTVYAPKHNRLPSVTISAIELLCLENGIPFKFADITYKEFTNFDAVAMASTSGGIKRISRFESTEFKENEIFNQLVSLLKKKYTDPKWTTKY
jgi:branched-chain amino acid aminotransferase